MIEGGEPCRFSNPFYAIDSLPKFTGDDMTYSSTRWAQDLEDNAQIFAWNPQQKLIIARRCLSGTAELWVKTEKTFGTYEELKAALLKEFPEAINCKQMHEMMSGRKKRPNETYYQYMLIMKELGKRAKFPDYVAIQYIIDGIDDYEANKIMLYGVTTYPVLKEKLNLYETFKQKQKQELEMRQNSVRPKGVETDCRKTQRCYKCGDAGHLSNSCTQGIKCFKCNRFGHIGRDCQMAAMKTQAHGAGASGSGNDRKCHPDRSMLVHGERDNDSNQRHECQNVLNVNKSQMVNKSVKQVKIGNFTTNCLVDTGSDLNLITFELFSKLNTKYKSEKMLLTGLGSCQIYSVGKFDTDLIIDKHCYRIHFYIVPRGAMPYDVILGHPFLSNTIAIVNKGVIEIRPQYYDDSYQRAICVSFSSDDSNTAVIVSQYKPLKVKDVPIKLKIVLKDDIPVTQRPRRLDIIEEKVVKQQIDECLSKENEDEGIRSLKDVLQVSADYGLQINQKMVKGEYSLPVIHDHIDKLSEVKDFDYIIEHRTGDTMRHVDALSKNICFVDSKLHARIKKVQVEDDSLKDKREILKGNGYEDYFMENEVIYKGVDKKVVVPKLMKQEIIMRAHGVRRSGKKKIKVIREKQYFIRKFYSKIEKVILMCVPCLLACRKAGKKEGIGCCIQ